MHTDDDRNNNFQVINLIERWEVNGDPGFDLVSPRLELKALRGTGDNFLECRVYGPEFPAGDAREKSPDWDTARDVKRALVPNGADCDTWVEVANDLIEGTLAESNEKVDLSSSAWGIPLKDLENRVIEMINGR